MSFSIDIDRVEAVLLVDGWHHVVFKTFDIRTFDIVKTSEKKSGGLLSLHEGGTGFGFSEQDNITGEVRRVAGPMMAVLAVRYTRQSDDQRTDEDL
jgi:hypothetical protein